MSAAVLPSTISSAARRARPGPCVTQHSLSPAATKYPSIRDAKIGECRNEVGAGARQPLVVLHRVERQIRTARRRRVECHAIVCADRALDRTDQEAAVLRAGIEQVALEEEQHRERIDDARQRLRHEARLEQRHRAEPQAVAPPQALGRGAGRVDDSPCRDLAGRRVDRRDATARHADALGRRATADVDAG
jgi:hypothetical protein